MEFALSEVHGKGGEGGRQLAETLLRVLDEGKANFRFVQEDGQSLKEKIEAVAKKIYGASKVSFSPKATKELQKYEELGFGGFPVCMAKTQYSLSDDPKKLGRPRDFELTVRDVNVSAGAGFVVVLTGDIMTLPGLPKRPAAVDIDLVDGKIVGLF